MPAAVDHYGVAQRYLGQVDEISATVKGKALSTHEAGQINGLIDRSLAVAQANATLALVDAVRDLTRSIGQGGHRGAGEPT